MTEISPVTSIINAPGRDYSRGRRIWSHTNFDRVPLLPFQGEFGAGKTHFVKGIAGSLWYRRTGTYLSRPSLLPTILIRSSNGEPFTLFHLDCYRFSKPEELFELGVEDYFILLMLQRSWNGRSESKALFRLT